MRFATFRDVPASERDGVATRLKELPAAESVLIETCHRVELVTVDARPDGSRSCRGVDAVHRVFEVAGGLDSAVLAEEQLLRQVRDAYEAALAAGRSGPILNELMRRALRFGRLVRSHARPGTDRSLGDPAVAWLRQHVAAGERVIVAGTGEMGRLVATRLAAAGHPITVVSSAPERGTRLLGLLPEGDHRSVVGPVTSDVARTAAGIALAVRSRTPALVVGSLDERRLPWVVDLSAPAAVEASAAALLGERLLALDRIATAVDAAPVLSAASEWRLRRRLAAEVDSFVAWLEARHGADAVAVLRLEADAVRRRHIARLARHARFDSEQLAAFEAASTAMLNELLHGPMVELRRGGSDAAAVRRMFGIEA